MFGGRWHSSSTCELLLLCSTYSQELGWGGFTSKLPHFPLSRSTSAMAEAAAERRPVRPTSTNIPLLFFYHTSFITLAYAPTYKNINKCERPKTKCWTRTNTEQEENTFHSSAHRCGSSLCVHAVLQPPDVFQPLQLFLLHKYKIVELSFINLLSYSQDFSSQLRARMMQRFLDFHLAWRDVTAPTHHLNWQEGQTVPSSVIMC